VFQAAPSCYADQQLDPTDSKISIDTFVPLGLFSLGLITIVTAFNCNFAMDSASEGRLL
jgi:hypothetical protein